MKRGAGGSSDPPASNLRPASAGRDCRVEAGVQRAKTGGRRLLGFAILVLASLFVYSPAFHGGWLWDDNEDLPQNLLLRDPAALSKIWFAPPGLDYYPLKTTVQWLQWHLWHNATLGYHLTNVGLHLLAALLFWRLLRQLGVRLAWFGALLFVIHPVVVESVAWITELKNTLSLPPLLLAMICYINFDAAKDDRPPSPVGLRRGSFRIAKAGSRPAFARPAAVPYLCSLSWYLIALLCKSAVVMFPAILLLYGWWKHGRITRAAVRASLPFFALSLVLGLFTVWLQQHRSIASSDVPIGGLALRTAVAGRALLFYFHHCLFPADLTPLYPRWTVAAGSPLDFWPWLVVLAVAAACWFGRAGWGRPALFGLGWFALNLAPALGFVPVSTMRFTWVTDHFAYVSLLGLIGLAVAGAGLLAARLPAPGRAAAAGIAAILCALLALESRAYAAAFASEESIWTEAVRRHPDSWMGQNNLGAVRLGQGRMAEAQSRFTEALRLNPGYADARANLGRALAAQGKLAEAIAQDEAVVRLRPDDALACYTLGGALAMSGRLAEAEAEFRRAAELAPRDAALRNDLGLVLARLGRAPDAIDQFAASLRLKPGDAEVENNLGSALGQAGRLTEAIGHFATAVRLQPGNARARFNYGAALLQAGQRNEGREQLQAALRLDPSFSAARDLLAR